MNANYDSSTKVERWSRANDACGTGENYECVEEQTSWGTLMSIQVRFNALSCSSTNLYANSGTSFDRVSDTTRTINSCNVYENSCETVTVGGQVVTDPANSCGPFTIDYSTLTLVSTQTTTNACGSEYVTSVYSKVGDDDRYLATVSTSYDPGYACEYTTATAISRARQCAKAALATKSLQNGDGVGGRAACTFTLAGDKSSAATSVAKWRLALYGTDQDAKYILTLTWMETINGKSRTWVQKLTVDGCTDPVCYYPGEGGEMLEPKSSEKCGYTYTKELVGVTIEVKDDTTAPNAPVADKAVTY